MSLSGDSTVREGGALILGSLHPHPCPLHLQPFHRLHPLHPPPLPTYLCLPIMPSERSADGDRRAK
jgi:hypothetical protein